MGIVNLTSAKVVVADVTDKAGRLLVDSLNAKYYFLI
jgi:hypothetical protein